VVIFAALNFQADSSWSNILAQDPYLAIEKKHFTQPLSKQEPLWKSPVRPETLQILEASRSVW